MSCEEGDNVEMRLVDIFNELCCFLNFVFDRNMKKLTYGGAGERGWLEEDESLSLVVVKIIRAHYDSGRKRRRGEVNRRILCDLDWDVGDGGLSPAIAKIIRAHYDSGRKK